MSDYCKDCTYDVKQRVGDKACPFNALYWHFLDRNRAKLFALQRLRTVYSTWDKMSEIARAETIASAERFLAELGDTRRTDAANRWE